MIIGPFMEKEATNLLLFILAVVDCGRFFFISIMISGLFSFYSFLYYLAKKKIHHLMLIMSFRY